MCSNLLIHRVFIVSILWQQQYKSPFFLKPLLKWMHLCVYRRVLYCLLQHENKFYYIEVAFDRARLCTAKIYLIIAECMVVNVSLTNKGPAAPHCPSASVATSRTNTQSHTPTPTILHHVWTPEENLFEENTREDKWAKINGVYKPGKSQEIRFLRMALFCLTEGGERVRRARQNSEKIL